MDAYGRGKVRFLRWVDGRQGSGYKIMYLWNWVFDLVLIRYPTGSYINWHLDPVPEGLEHHRLNITVRTADKGGLQARPCEVRVRSPETPYESPDGWREGEWYDHRRVVRFRPDLVRHKVTRIESGERWVVSIGWLRKRK